ncbi:MAG: hypothetical protein WKF92_15400 [Pyrinomonadaceae bacterium]
MKILVSLLVLFFAFSPGFACSCVNTSVPVKEHNKYLKNIEAIFDGEVVSVGEKRIVVRKYEGGFTLKDTVSPVKFKVFRIWKGFDQSEIIVETDVESSCRFIPAVGSRYTVYASKGLETDGPLSIGYCSIGKFDDAKMKIEYGEGKLMNQPTPIPRANEKTENFFSIVWNRIVSFFA